ncbi:MULTISPECIES: hypothetical protein [Paenibacillus]|uniref:hypothetical protein n=1 Tax=Paenibacillus TaxID=44249 RepID=UPI0008399678|nr:MULTISPECIES: hypothetical protein [Paenibacillus]GIP22505.1 hypothetical protein J22TS3_27800 [Paenibacillus sp. J22TS3]
MSTSAMKKEAQKLVGKTIVAYKKDGSMVTGKLVKISGSRLILAPRKGKTVHTKAIIPLALFDLLAIGTAPYAYGGYGGYGYGGYGPYPYGGYGYGNPFIF